MEDRSFANEETENQKHEGDEDVMIVLTRDFRIERDSSDNVGFRIQCVDFPTVFEAERG